MHVIYASDNLGGQVNALAWTVKWPCEDAYSKLSWRVMLTLTLRKHSTPHSAVAGPYFGRGQNRQIGDEKGAFRSGLSFVSRYLA